MSRSNDPEFRSIIFKAWKQHKKLLSQTAKNINALMGDEFMSKDQITQYFQHFDDEGNKDIFCNNKFNVFPSHKGKELKNFSDFLPLLMSKNEGSNGKMLAKEGRFVFSLYCCKNLKKIFTVLHDLFRDIKRTTFLSIEYNIPSWTIIGNYLLIEDHSYDNRENSLDFLKVNYDNLSVNEIKAFNIPVGFGCCNILSSQSDNQKFVMIDLNKVIICQIHEENDEIVMSDVKDAEIVLNHQRFIDNKVQGFVRERDDRNSMVFCEFDLETMKKKKTDVPLKLDDDELRVNSFKHFLNCWSKDRFYQFYDMHNSKHQLLFFDPETLKWADVKIACRHPKALFVDENEFLTLQTGGFKKYGAYHRIALRKPDTLMNLAKLATVHQSSFYENDKYINMACKMLL